jgi:broad specificity phosphatase PhoE
VPTLIEPGFDEIRAGDLDGARIEAYWSWMDQHTAGDRLPHGESIDDALRRYADALRHLLARKEKVTLVVIHEIALRYIAAAAATGPSDLNDTAFPNAAPYLFDEPAVRRAAASLAALTLTAKPATTADPSHPTWPGRSYACSPTGRHRISRGSSTPWPAPSTTSATGPSCCSS